MRNPVGENDSVLDLGCGLADLYGHLTQNGWKGKYIGIDINKDLLKIAWQRHKDIDVREQNILEDDRELESAWVISSGMFNGKLHFEEPKCTGSAERESERTFYPPLWTSNIPMPIIPTLRT